MSLRNTLQQKANAAAQQAQTARDTENAQRQAQQQQLMARRIIEGLEESLEAAAQRGQHQMLVMELSTHGDHYDVRQYQSCQQLLDAIILARDWEPFLQGAALEVARQIKHMDLTVLLKTDWKNDTGQGRSWDVIQMIASWA